MRSFIVICYLGKVKLYFSIFRKYRIDTLLYCILNLDWYRSTWGKTNVYVLTYLTLGGLWTGMEDHTMWTIFDHLCQRMPSSAQAKTPPSACPVKPNLQYTQLNSTMSFTFSPAQIVQEHFLLKAQFSASFSMSS
jgi:hypothetical protein